MLGTLFFFFFDSDSVCVLVRFTSLFTTFFSREGSMRSPQAFLPAALFCTVITHPGPHRQLASLKASPVSLTHIFSSFAQHVWCCSLPFQYGISLFNGVLAWKQKLHKVLPQCYCTFLLFYYLSLRSLEKDPQEKGSKIKPIS